MKLRVQLLGVAVLCVASLAGAAEPSRAGKAHELFARDAGTWDCEVKMFFKGPDAPPAEFKGVEVNRLLVGGLYMQTTFEYRMGQRGAFEGHSLMGYDPRSKRYVGTWADNQTSVPSQVNGEYDENAKTLTVHSTVVDGRGRELKSKQVTTWLDDSRKRLEIFLVVDAGGKESQIKLMESVGTKRK